MSISEAEKIKSPTLSFVAGMIFSAGITWGAISSIHNEQFKMQELIKTELLRKNYELGKKNIEQTNKLQAQENEITSLRKRLEIDSGRVANGKTEKLQNIIEKIDAEITLKKKVLAMQSSLTPNEQKSDSYVRTEREIDALIEQRSQAQKQLIEVNVK